MEKQERMATSKKESAMNPKPAGPSQNVDIRQWEYKKMPGMHMIVAALIATVSFIAGFTIPGGFIQSCSAYQGMAIFTKQLAFQAFIVADTLTILLSIISATVFYFIAGDYISQDKVIDVACHAKTLVILALLAMMVTFAAGTYTVPEYSSALAVSLCLLVGGVNVYHLQQCYAQKISIQSGLFQHIALHKPKSVFVCGWEKRRTIIIISGDNCTEELLKWKPKLIKETDTSDLTPLHYAARLGHAGRASQILSVDESAAYFADKYDKNTALHMAASLGHKSVIKELLSRCPSLWDMVNSNDKNALHIALEHNQVEVVEFILENCPVIGSLLTQKDSRGNAAIDLLATAEFDVPKREEHVIAYIGALNNRNLMTLELERKATSKKESAMNPKLAGPSQNVGIRQWEYGKMPGMHMIVATLIATVSFIAGFTIPGGFIQSGSAYQGMAIFTRQLAFQAFIIADTLTILLSIISATVFYFIAVDYISQDKVIDAACRAKTLAILALLAMMVTFAAGTYAVLEYSSVLAVSLCLLGCCFFLIYWFWGEIFCE
ncbi:hypothetical protein LguiA_030952 [Lonicera macranthoides]